MAFQKGRAKTGGRSKGVKNKVSCNLKDMMHSFLSDNKEEFQEAWLMLPDDEKVRTYLKAIEFVVPKAKPVPQITDDDESAGFTIELR